MSATVTVLYPKGAKFDMDYYMSTHMPLVQRKWEPEGMTAWKVVKYGEEAPHLVGATLEWESKAHFEKAAAGAAAQEVMGDIKNFTDSEPVIMPGEDMGSS